MPTFKLPSGLTGEVRGLSVRDGRYLTDPKAIRDGEVDDYVMRNTWRATIDPGPYDIKSEVDWDKILLGDRLHLLLDIRLATFPDEPYVFKVSCPSGTCKPFEWEIDVEKFLSTHTKKLADKHAKTFREGNRFSAKMPDGTPFVFKLKTGLDQKRLQTRIEQMKNGPKKAREALNRIAESILSSIVSIEGVKDTYAARLEYLESLPMGAGQKIVDIIQEPDCGIETTIEVQCPKCDQEQEIELPFGRTLFAPTSRRSISKTTTTEEKTSDGGETQTADSSA